MNILFGIEGRLRATLQAAHVCGEQHRAEALCCVRAGFSARREIGRKMCLGLKRACGRPFRPQISFATFTGLKPCAMRGRSFSPGDWYVGLFSLLG